jgi:hypothetical protein
VSAAQADVSVEGRIEPRGKGGFHAVLTIRDTNGELLGTREIDRPDPSCDAMTQPVALVIAVMIDPLTPPAPPKEREVVVERHDVIVPVPVLVPVEAQPEPPKFRFEGSVAAMGAVGLLSDPAVGIGAFGVLEPRAAIPFIGFGSYFVSPNAEAEQGAHTAMSMLLFGSGFCPLWHHAKVAHLYACATGHLGVIFSRSTGYASPPTDAPRVVWDAAVELRSTIVVVKPFAIRFGIQGIVPILRPRFTYDRADGSQGEAFKVAPVAGLVDLGVGVVFP